MRTLESVLTAAGVDLSGWKLEWATGVSADGLAIAGYGTYNGTTRGFLATLDTAPSYACVGFKPPANRDIVSKNNSRVVPLRMALLDSDGLIVSGIVPPVLRAQYSNGAGTSDYAGQFKYAGRGDEANTLAFSGTEWVFNLGTWDLAPGTYEISAVSSDEKEYVIDPTCTVRITVQ
jgi:hypothetical protein